MYIARVNWIHMILALVFVVIGLVLVVDALSSRDLEWPLGLFLLVVGVVWIIRIRDPDTFPETSGPTLRGSDWLSAQ